MSNIQLKDATQISDDIILYPIHLPEDSDTDRYVLDTSSLRLGVDWYSGLISNSESLVIYQNELFRCLTDGQAGPPSLGLDWVEAELGNIRKTNNRWYTQLPRFLFDENGNSDPEYMVSNRFRSDWLEVTLEFKDLMINDDLYEKRIKLSNIKLISDLLIY